MALVGREMNTWREGERFFGENEGKRWGGGGQANEFEVASSQKVDGGV